MRWHPFSRKLNEKKQPVGRYVPGLAYLLIPKLEALS
jgi:hypothetical protein